MKRIHVKHLDRTSKTAIYSGCLSFEGWEDDVAYSEIITKFEMKTM